MALGTLSAISWGKKLKFGSGVSMSGTVLSGFMVRVATRFQIIAPRPKLQIAAPVAKLLFFE